MKILQIVPGYGKKPNGLLDYARVLADELKAYGIESTFDMEEAENVDALFLNYSNYGYQKKGVPFQLYFQLASLSRKKHIPLYTFFHEVYAGRERILTSSYWLHPVQKYLYKLLFRLSAASFCGNEVIYNIIKNENRDISRLHYTPLFSNIPVLDHFIPFEERENTAVVFGTPGRRKAVYKHIQGVNTCCEALGITAIIDIGDQFDPEWVKEIQVPVLAKGRLEVAEITRYCGTSKYGFIDYPLNILGKSGIFAAYAGNAMCIVNFDTAVHKETEGLVENKHYYNIQSFGTKPLIAPAIASANIFEWYQPRNAKNHAMKISSTLPGR